MLILPRLRTLIKIFKINIKKPRKNEASLFAKRIYKPGSVIDDHLSMRPDRSFRYEQHVSKKEPRLAFAKLRHKSRKTLAHRTCTR